MAMSCYSNWESFQQTNSDTAIADPELQSLINDTWNADYFLDPNDLFPSENCTNFANGVSSDNLNFLASEPFLQQEFGFEHFHCPKRQNGYSPSFFNALAPHPFPVVFQDYAQPEIVTPTPFLDFPAAGYGNGYSDGSCKSGRKEAAAAAAPASLSAQSAAARQRRRRITEKTQELGKLVPGGQKMNTAEMLQSAYKYIKFLQAQYELLEFVHNQEVAEAPYEGEELLQMLLESPLVQEKLYSTENCLVPHKFFQELQEDRIFESNRNLTIDQA